MRRLLAIILCLAMVLSVLPLGAAAATEEEICRQIRSTYYKALNSSGKDTLNGYCGLMAGLQLYFLGVESMPLIYDGRDFYDAYKNKDVTTSGYPVRRYPDTQYTLEEALMTITNGGTRDVYNVMLGFHWTNTRLGGIYGHVVVIHAILDGVVYFSECFNNCRGRMAGQPIDLTIDEFVELYNSWTRFEGAVHFGTGTYLESCDVYSANWVAKIADGTPVYRELTVDMETQEMIRTIPAGERVEVTAVIKDPDGRLFYRVTEDGKDAYISTEHVQLVEGNYTDVQLRSSEIEAEVLYGQTSDVQAVAVSENNSIHALKVIVRDSAGAAVLACEEAGNGCMVDLEAVLETNTLPEGNYTYEILANVLNYYAADNTLSAQYDAVTLCKDKLTVGDMVMTRAMPEDKETPVKDGWVWEKGTWYNYDSGTPRTGWYTEDGIRYRLKWNGAITTGWSTEKGRVCYFSDTGALRIGWMENEYGTYYMDHNGQAVVGWQQIDGNTYYFHGSGQLQKDLWLETEEGKYYLDEQGKLAVGWLETGDGYYYFGEDGLLHSYTVKQEDGLRVEKYTPGSKNVEIINIAN